MAQVGVKATLALPVHDHATDPAGGKLYKEAFDVSIYRSEIEFSESDSLGASNDNEKTTRSLTPVLLKEIRIKINPSYPYYIFNQTISSIIRVKFDLNSSDENYLAFARVYLNGSPKGALRSKTGGYYTFSEDINFGVLKDGDLIQLYGYTENALADCMVKNLRLYFNYIIRHFTNIFEFPMKSFYGGSNADICLFTNTLT